MDMSVEPNISFHGNLDNCFNPQWLSYVDNEQGCVHTNSAFLNTNNMCIHYLVSRTKVGIPNVSSTNMYLSSKYFSLILAMK